MEAAVPSLAYYRRRRHRYRTVGCPGLQPGDDLRHVRERALREVAHLGARIGDDLLVRAVIELLGHFQGPGSRPAEPGAAQLLHRGQVVEPGRALPLVLDPHAERTLEVPRQGRDRLGVRSLEDALLRRVPHPEHPGPCMRAGHDLEIRVWNKVANLQFTLARDRQRRGLHPADPDHAARTPADRDGCSAGQRQVVDLVGLPARDGGGVEAGMLAVGSGAAERLADGLSVLRSEQHPQDLAAIAAVLQDLLAYQLPLAVAIGSEPDPLGSAQSLANSLELRRLVAAQGRLGAVQPFWPEQHRRPALPGRVHILRLAQIQQMALSRENGAVAGPNGGADILRLTGFLGDDDLIGHESRPGSIRINR